MNELHEFPDQVRSILRREGLTQQDLARRLGKSEARVSQMLSGRNLTLATMAEAATALHHEVHVILRRRRVVASEVVDWLHHVDVDESWCAA